MKEFLTILLLMLTINSYTQVKQDTISINGFRIVLVWPNSYYKKTFNYEEGVFYDYIIPQDHSVITFHFGSMVALPLIVKKNVICSFQIKGLLKDERGMYIEDGKIKNCREINIIPYNLNIIYDKVNENLRKKYDTIFDNIKVLKD